MKITNPFRRRRPDRRKALRQVAAIRVKTGNARQVLADTDAMLAAGHRSGDRPGIKPRPKGGL